ncbi:hypothetical protein V8C42DRAFT_268703 [Trichoderma barbatum]
MSFLECTCGRPCRTEQALLAHRKAVASNICPRCNKCFRSAKSRKNHSFETCNENLVNDRQWRCNDCWASFDTRAALSQHFETVEHATEFRCCDCNKSFKTGQGLHYHLKDKIHRKPVAKPQSCKDCDRTFKNSWALQQHLNSVIHRPISNLSCLAGQICGVGCNAKFSSPSAMVAHMESGTCQSGMDRKKLNRLVLVQDSENLITSPNGIVESSGWASLENEPDSPSCSGVITPNTDSDDGVLLTPSSSQLDLMSLVGRGLTEVISFDAASDCAELPMDHIYFCPLCPGSERRFVGRRALEQHMQSPAHAPKMFHCPSLLFQGKSGETQPDMKNFSTISGLVAHIESGACRGGSAGLRTVMQYMEGLLEDMGISLKLLST